MPAKILRILKLARGPEDLSPSWLLWVQGPEILWVFLPVKGVCPLTMKEIVTKHLYVKFSFLRVISAFLPSFGTSGASSEEEAIKENQLLLWGTISTTNQDARREQHWPPSQPCTVCCKRVEGGKATYFLYRLSSNVVSYYTASPYTLNELMWKLTNLVADYFYLICVFKSNYSKYEHK